MMPEPAQPAWNTYAVASFNGQHDTRISTGEDYPCLTLADIFTMPPANKPKGSGPAFIPSSYADFDAREHAKQREQGKFVALTGDIDRGDHAPQTVQRAVMAFCGQSAYLIYSSAHASNTDRRWRIILPLAEPVPFDTWHDAQTAFFAFMESRGIDMDHALARAAQPVYLPNVPPVHAKTGAALRDEDGKPLYYMSKATPLDRAGLSLDAPPVSEGIAAIRRKRAEDQAKRERMRVDAEKARANQPRGDGSSIVDDFNAGNSVATMLEICGYEQSPRSAEDWRSPHQTGETYATRIMGSKWFSLSQSDASAGLGQRCADGCFGDAYDLYVHFKHGGDHKAAYKALRAENYGSNVVQFPTPEVPDWMREIPPYDEILECGEPIYDLPEVVDAGDASRHAKPSALPFEWAGQTAPVLDGLWLIEDWLPKSGIGAIYGHPGSGKSFFALDMAAHIAAGQPWAGKHVEQGLVVYVVAEGQTGFRNRLFAMQQAGKIAPDAPFVFIPCPIDMQAADGDLGALMATIQQAVEQAGTPIAMLVIDTLSKTFGAGKENTDDMAGYIANCQRVSSAFDCFTAVVHHRPKDSESRDLRGHSSLRGGIETAILVEAGDIKTATTIKQKDGEDNMVVRFKLERVVIGEDRRGKEISTCLTVIVDGEVPMQFVDARDVRKNRLTGHKRTALNAIEEIAAKVGVEPPAGIPPDAIDRYRTWKAVDATTVSERLKNEFYALEDGDEDKRRDNARRNANRALKDLKSAGVIGSWEAWIWVN